MLEHERELRKDSHHDPDDFGNMEVELSLDDAVEVRLEILTNWGHLQRVGLTEVQAMTGDKRVLPILPSNISVSGGDDEKGDLANLINGKTKEIDIGAKDIKIYLNSHLAFEGQLDQGCGNQVFEYGQLVPLQTELEEDYPRDGHYDFHLKAEPVNRRAVAMAKSLESSPIRSVSTNDRGWQSKPTSSRGQEQKDAPGWFKEFRKNDNASDSWLDRNGSGETSRNSTACSRASSGRRSRMLTDTSEDEDPGSRRSSGRRSCWTDVSPTFQSFDAADKTYDFGFDLGSESVIGIPDSTSVSREGSARYGRRAKPPDAGFGRPQSNVEVGNNRMLEESLSSLHLFEKLHQDRLMAGLEDYAIDRSLSRDGIPKKSPNKDQSRNNAEPMEDAEFIIPELPQGHQLVLNILTTWGDRHYVGLNGIELFSVTGEPIAIRQIWADPSDINVLQEYSRDPRVVTNLTNGIYRTKDDLNLWLAPFTAGENHLVFVDFQEPTKLAMIRIWNYNKSRIHSCRGARDVEISLDDRCIFKGEIARACGEVTGSLENFGDTILFTLDEKILENISHYDDNFTSTFVEETPFDGRHSPMRPSTGDSTVSGDRPFTSAFQSNRPSYGHALPTNVSESGEYALEGRCIELTLLSNWGDPLSMGLNGFQILSEDGETLNIAPEMVETSPNLDCGVLLDGENVTTDPEHGWRAPFRDRLPITLQIHFPELELFAGIRVWNYNASLEESYSGVKQMSVKISGRDVAPPGGFLIRRAPGNCHFDFAQEISFATPFPYSLLAADVSDVTGECPSSRMSVFRDYEPSVMPCGFVFQLQLLSTWGDPYYVGLNGLEVYNGLGEAILLTEGDIAAYPDSVNVLDGINDDVRTPDKLIDGVNDTRDGRHMWLSPILPNIINRVYIIFDFPVTISMLKLWNYGKTAGRGVRDFALLVDDLLVYHGTLGKVEGDHDAPVLHRTVLFTTNERIHEQEKPAAMRKDFAYDEDNHTKSQNINKVDQSDIYVHTNNETPSNENFIKFESATRRNKRRMPMLLILSRGKKT